MQKQDPTLQIEKLEQERNQLQRELDSLRQLYRSEVDADIGAGDPKMAERDRVGAMMRFKQGRLNTVERVLNEARQGLYGICEQCGQSIDPDRLEAVPDTTLCITCQRTAERHNHL